MFRPIPKKILKQSATLKQCIKIDTWENATYETVNLSKICIQPTHKQIKRLLNTEVTLTSLIFFDARLSQPSGLRFEQLQEASLAAGAPLVINFGGLDHTVETVDVLYDDEGNLHHYEIGVV